MQQHYAPLDQNLVSEVKCFVDAAIQPDSPSSMPRKAGLGIHILDHSSNLKLFIRAHVQNCPSVLIAEASALLMGAIACDSLGFNQVAFYTDNQILATYLNTQRTQEPPDWRMKPITQDFCNWASTRSISIAKIHRTANEVAHKLAVQALKTCVLHGDSATFICNNPMHADVCPARAITDVSSRHCIYFAAICCK